MKTKFLLLTFLLTSFIAFGQQRLEPQFAPVNPEYEDYIEKISRGEEFNGLIPSPVKYNFDNFTYSGAKDQLPSSYDLRTIAGGAYLTSVKDQGNEGACWAFATYGAIESYWKKNNYGTFDLSEQNLATCHKLNNTPSQGGHANMSIAYLSRYSGPISESDDPYTLPANPTCREGFTPVAFATEMRELPGINDANFSMDAVKRAVMEYGAIYVNMRAEENGEYGNYMNSSNFTFFYNGNEATNHGVTLVGWDDNKLVTGGSAATPSNRGAWIIKNSWGQDWGENGYFYISYEDTKALSTISYFPSYNQYSSLKNAYYYDITGINGSLGYPTTVNYAIVKFTAAENLQLNSIGTYAVNANLSISAEVYSSFNGTSLSNLLGSSNTSNCEFPGYYTVNLNSPVEISSGSDFYIRIKYTTLTEYGSIPCESYSLNYNSNNISIQSGKYWIGYNGTNWESVGLGTDTEINLCIKAYTTTLVSQAPVVDFTASQTNIEAGSQITFSDLSTGIPTSWSWNFEGGSPSTSSERNPSVTYNNAGIYTVSLTATNSIGNDSETKTGYITVTAPTSISAFSYNFESCTEFAVDDFAPCTTYDGDGRPTYGVENVQFNNSNYIGSFIAFNPASTTPSMGSNWDAYEGNKYGACFGASPNAANPTNNDWFITPRIEILSSTTFSFWAKSITAQFGLERFNVLISTSNNNISSFTRISGNTYTEAPTTWTYYEYDLSSYINQHVYIAIQCVSSDALAFLIDDINVISEAPEIIADFSASATAGCDILNVQFTNQSTGTPISCLWNFGDGTTSTEANPQHTYTNHGTYTVSLTVSDGNNSDNKTITNYIVVSQTPGNITTSGEGTYCGNTIVSAIGGTGGTIYWQGTQSNGTNTNIASNSQTVSQSGTYYFRAENNGCWSNESSVSVTILPAPGNISISGGGFHCESTDLVATGGTNGTIYWQGTQDNGTSELNQNTTQTITQSGTYYFRAKNEACWGEQASVNVTILPTPGNITITGGEQPECGNTTLTASGGNNGIIYWQDTQNNGTSEIDNNTAQTVTQSGTYYFRAKNDGCWGEQASVNVTILPTPGHITITGGGIHCESTDLIATGGVGGTIYWQGNTNNGTSEAEQISTQTITQSGTYYFRAKNEACWGEQVSTNVTILPTPGPITITGGEQPECGSITLTASGGNDGTIYWQGTAANGESEAIQNTTQIVSQTGTYYFRAKNNGCWGEQASVSVIVYPNPVVDLGNDISECTDEPIVLDAGSGFADYSWDGGVAGGQTFNVIISGNYEVTITDENGCTASDEINVQMLEPVNISVSSTSNTNIQTPNGTATVDVSQVNNPQIAWDNGATTATITGLSEGTYFVNVRNNNGCESSLYVEVISEAAPIADFSANTTNGCDNVNIQFTNESSSNATSWEWDFGDGNTSNEENPTHVYNSTGKYTIKLKAINEFGNDEEEKTDYITIGETPEITYTVTDASSQNASDGSITLTITGGQAPYTIVWENHPNATSETITDLSSGQYNVTVTEVNGCLASEQINVGYGVFVDKQLIGYNIFPNPATDIVNITFESSYAEKFEVVNILGEIIYNENINSNEIKLNVSNYKTGTYLINLYFNDTIKTHKIIIE